MKTSDVRIHDSLTIVVIDGYEPFEDYPETDMAIDSTGSANWLIKGLGMVSDLQESEPAGDVLWSDYDTTMGEKWRFSILIDSEDTESVAETCEEHGYEIVSTREVSEPIRYGDSQQGTVAVCHHPDGWIVLR